MSEQLQLTRPDDWHIHLRDEDSLERTVADAAERFQRAIVMPNLVPPVTSVDAAEAYRSRILEHVPAGHSFDPLMVLYLTDNTSPEQIRLAAESPFVHAAKLYPSGATTNSDAGVTAVENLYPVFEAMAEHDLVLAIHGEVTDPDSDIFDREKLFIDRHLAPIAERFPNLRIVFEHITTSDAAHFVAAARDGVAATITAHHLLFNRNDLLAGGIRPHKYCLPILKRNEHQQALIAAATSGSPRFFLGTDSAPHVIGKKESDCGCAGCYTACAGIELYAEAFERAAALDKLEAFASFYGADFYRLPRNNSTITLRRDPWTMPTSLPMAGDKLVPLCAGETVNWQLAN